MKKIIYVVMKSNETTEGANYRPACTFSTWKRADDLCSECQEYNKNSPKPPNVQIPAEISGSVDDTSAKQWDDFGEAMNGWRENHPMKKYIGDTSIKFKTTDYYGVEAVQYFEEE